MILIDANLLLYAHDASSSRHAQARAWLEAVMSGDEDVRLSLVTLLAFVRIGTNPAVFSAPLTVSEAIDVVAEWLDLPNVSVAEPTVRHWSVLAKVADEGQVRGAGVMDAHLAALATEHGATLCSTDRDFARFPGLASRNPLL